MSQIELGAGCTASVRAVSGAPKRAPITGPTRTVAIGQWPLFLGRQAGFLGSAQANPKRYLIVH